MSHETIFNDISRWVIIDFSDDDHYSLLIIYWTVALITCDFEAYDFLGKRPAFNGIEYKQQRFFIVLSKCKRNACLS